MEDDQASLIELNLNESQPNYLTNSTGYDPCHEVDDHTLSSLWKDICTIPNFEKSNIATFLNGNSIDSNNHLFFDDPSFLEGEELLEEDYSISQRQKVNLFNLS